MPRNAPWLTHQNDSRGAGVCENCTSFKCSAVATIFIIAQMLATLLNREIIKGEFGINLRRKLRSRSLL